jgi:hypothetical protein
MMSNAKDKIALDMCMTRTSLYATLADLCEKKGYQYDMSRSFSSNARQAAESMRYGVAELIKHAERIEEKL